jgi:transposase
MWTAENQRRCDRSKLRYPSDVTDAEWLVLKPHIPRARRGGNRRHVDEREIVNGLMSILTTGCQWRAIPKDLPARSRLYNYFDLWRWDATLEPMHHAFHAQCRENAEREASPSAAIIASQSVKSAKKGGGIGPTRRCFWQDDQGQEAASSRRYPGPLDACSRAWC